MAMRGGLSPSSDLMCEIVNCLHLPEKVGKKPLTVATMSIDFNNKFVILTVDLYITFLTCVARSSRVLRSPKWRACSQASRCV